MLYYRYTLRAPVRILASSIGMPTCWAVASDYRGDGPAVTLYGDRAGDASHVHLPPIRMEGAWKGSIACERLDNVIFEGVSGESLGGAVGIDLVSIRQCHVRSLQVSKSISEVAVRMRSFREDQGDACNHVRFDYLSVHNNASRTYLQMLGGGKAGGMDRLHDVTIGQAFLHCPWGNAVEELPDEMRETFRPIPRTFLDMRRCYGVKIDHVAMRSDPGITTGAVALFSDIEQVRVSGYARCEPGRPKMVTERIRKCELELV